MTNLDYARATYDAALAAACAANTAARAALYAATADVDAARAALDAALYAARAEIKALEDQVGDMMETTQYD